MEDVFEVLGTNVVVRNKTNKSPKAGFESSRAYSVMLAELPELFDVDISLFSGVE